MPLSIKGKHSLNALIKKFGKAKGRNIFYSMEHEHPEWVNKWRENKKW